MTTPGLPEETSDCGADSEQVATVDDVCKDFSPALSHFCETDTWSVLQSVDV